MRALRFDIPKVPNPTRVTFVPLRRDRSMPPTRASIAFVAAAFVIPASFETLSISSVLFIDSPPSIPILLEVRRDTNLLNPREKYHSARESVKAIVPGKSRGTRFSKGSLRQDSCPDPVTILITSPSLESGFAGLGGRPR